MSQRCGIFKKYCHEKKGEAGSCGFTVKAWEWSESSNSCRQICRLQKRLILSLLGRKEILKVSWKMVELLTMIQEKQTLPVNTSVLFLGAILCGDELFHPHRY